MAYGARLESVLGASPRGFESPILRHRTPEPAQVPGFSLRLQRKVPIVGEGRCFNESRVFPLVMDLEGKNRGTKYEISTNTVWRPVGSFPAVVACGAAGVPGAGAHGRAARHRAWLRCPWAAAGPGRASRRRAERSSRRGRLAGGPPPTGTPSSPAPQQDPPGPPHRRRLSCCEHCSQALPPPAGSAAGPRRSCGGLQSGVPVVRVLPPWPCRRPRAPQPGPTTPACHMRPQPTDARARLRSLRADRQPGAARLAGPRPRPLRLRVPRRSLRPGARRGPRPSRTASSGAGPSRCSSSRPRTPNQ